MDVGGSVDGGEARGQGLPSRRNVRIASPAGLWMDIHGRSGKISTVRRVSVGQTGWSRGNVADGILYSETQAWAGCRRHPRSSPFFLRMQPPSTRPNSSPTSDPLRMQHYLPVQSMYRPGSAQRRRDRYRGSMKRGSENVGCRDEREVMARFQ